METFFQILRLLYFLIKVLSGPQQDQVEEIDQMKTTFVRESLVPGKNLVTGIPTRLGPLTISLADCHENGSLSFHYTVLGKTRLVFADTKHGFPVLGHFEDKPGWVYINENEYLRTGECTPTATYVPPPE